MSFQSTPDIDLNAQNIVHNYEYNPNLYANYRNIHNNYQFMRASDEVKYDFGLNYYGSNYNEWQNTRHGMDVHFETQQSVYYGFNANNSSVETIDTNGKSYQTFNANYYLPQNLPHNHWNQNQYQFHNNYTNFNPNSDHYYKRDFPKNNCLSIGMSNTVSANNQDLDRNKFNSLNNLDNFAINSNNLSNINNDAESAQILQIRQKNISQIYSTFIPTVTPSLKNTTNSSDISKTIKSEEYPEQQEVIVPEVDHLMDNTNSSHSSSQTSNDSSITVVFDSKPVKSNDSTIKKVVKDNGFESRREKNRMAAKKCRKKKLDSIESYEEIKASLVCENYVLENEVKLMRERIFAKKMMILNHSMSNECKQNQKLKQ